MLYFISNNTTFKNINNITIEKSLKYLNSLKWISVDTETTGLDPHIHNIILIQLGNKKHQFVIDLTSININKYAKLLNTKNLIFQNAKFDLQFLFNFNIIPTGYLWDTMLAEQVLYNYYNESTIANLKYLADKYCNYQLDKTQRNILFARGVIHEKDVIYAGKDVLLLEDIMNKQYDKAIQTDCLKAIQLENKVVIPLAYIEYNGMYLDSEMWKIKDDELFPILQAQKQTVLDIILNTKYGKTRLNKQTNLFDDSYTIDLNLNSDNQMKPIFKSLGIDITSDKNKSGESISSAILVKFENDYPLVKEYLKYTKLDKSYTTYGEKFLDNINPATKRIHTEYNQLITTSRISSRNPNLNNIPKDKYTRSCFKGQNGNSMIDIDYSDQEGRIFANFANDQNLIAFYQGDFNDGHSYVAKLCFKDELKNIPLGEVAEKRPDLRFKAKSGRFAINIFV